MDCLPRQNKVAVVERWPSSVGSTVLPSASTCTDKPLTRSLGKQPTFRDATTGFPAKWRQRSERRKFWSKFSAKQKHYPDPGSRSLHKYGISALVSQTPLHGETSGGVAKCQLFCLFSQVFWRLVETFSHYLPKLRPGDRLYLLIFAYIFFYSIICRKWFLICGGFFVPTFPEEMLISDFYRFIIIIIIIIIII